MPIKDLDQEYETHAVTSLSKWEIVGYQTFSTDNHCQHCGEVTSIISDTIVAVLRHKTSKQEENMPLKELKERIHMHYHKLVLPEKPLAVQHYPRKVHRCSHCVPDTFGDDKDFPAQVPAIKYMQLPKGEKPPKPKEKKEKAKVTPLSDDKFWNV